MEWRRGEGLVLALLSEGGAGEPGGDLGSGTGKQLPSPLELLGHPQGTQRWAQHLRADTESGASVWRGGTPDYVCSMLLLCGAPRRWQLGEKPDPAGRRMDLQGSVCASGE